MVRLGQQRQRKWKRDLQQLSEGSDRIEMSKRYEKS